MREFITLLLLNLAPFLFGGDLPLPKLDFTPPALFDQSPPEIAKLLAEKNPVVQARIVKAMAEKYGPRETLEIMVRSGLPFTGETHLLVHEIGNVAYERFGEDALKECDESFLSACYHGVIINMMGDKGIEGVARMLERCRADGAIIMTQCTHASGHGFLARSDYKVFKALALCDKLETYGTDIPIFSCHDGIFMENIFGVHKGEPSPNRMVRNYDPFYPCNAVPEKYQPGCWANQATLMYQSFKGDLRKVAEHCDLVKNPEHQKICYDNFARQIHPLTEGRAERAAVMCENATGKWKDDCVISLVSAAFSVGDRELMPYELCRDLESAGKTQCYERLLQLIETHGKTSKERAKFCGFILEKEKQEECAKHFNLPRINSSALDGNLLEKLAREKGPRAAYEYLKANTADPVRAHDLAHLSGTLVYQYEGQKGVSVCDSDFAFGCFHGFFEALIGDRGAQALEEARESCLTLSSAGKIASCIHGIGHGIFAWKGKMGESLEQCGKLAQAERVYCFDGAFMEFYTGVMANNEKPKTADAVSWEFCLGLPAQYRNQCVRNHTFYLFSLYKDSASVPQKCADLPEYLRGMCVQSVGLRAGQSPEADAGLCNAFKSSDDRAYCLTSAAQEITFQGKNGGPELCDLLTADWRVRCQETIAFTKNLYR